MSSGCLQMLTKHTLYSQLKIDSSQDDECVYAISAIPYPSHIRTLLPASESHMVHYMALERARRRLKTLIILLAIFAVCATLVSVSLVLAFQRQTETDMGQMSQSQPWTWGPSNLKTVVKQITGFNSSHFSHSDSNTDDLPSYIIQSRTKCVRKCWAYAAFRFRASCDHGYCSCDATNYDPLTCLPVLGGCHIQKSVPGNAAAMLKGRKQRIFNCKTNDEYSSNIHVLSIFGNHRSVRTAVKVTGSASTSAILALVSYHPVTWRLHIHPGLHLKRIILVSYNHLPHTFITFNTTTGDSPEVVRLYSQTGYGEDRYGGHTPLLLQNIVKNFGNIKSFTGTSHADEWTIDVS